MYTDRQIDLIDCWTASFAVKNAVSPSQSGVQKSLIYMQNIYQIPTQGDKIQLIKKLQIIGNMSSRRGTYIIGHDS